VRPLADSLDEDELPLHWRDDLHAPRRRRARRIVAVCVLASLGVIGLAAQRRYDVVDRIRRASSALSVSFSSASSPPAASAASKADAQSEGLVATAQQALAAGDIEVAQRNFDKASALAPSDPRVLLGEVLVANAKADVPWLAMRLIAPGASVASRTTQAELDERATTARRAADAALGAAPQDPPTLRAQLDSLRLAGDLDGARAHVVAILGQSSDPETEYVLAALDLAQSGPVPSTTVDRLRKAVAAETTPGRASAALVYALARSGDVADAKAALSKLDASARPYPLLPLLHGLLDGDRKATAAPTADSSTPATSAAAPTADAPEPQATEPPSRAPAANPASRPLDRGALQLAVAAVRSGDLERAERIYQGILATDPKDSQALTGLGDVLRSDNDPWGAIEAYQKAIAVNPSYVPALIGLADTQWARGDHDKAAKTYAKIVDRFPDGLYPAYVRERATGGP
jgi:tetratricopeptide (TPR) repeat protein